jgi:hypothetical protein
MAPLDRENEAGDQPNETTARDSSAAASNGWLETITQFDWLKIPGAVRALARLVTGSAEAAGAWLEILKAKGEQRAGAIRDVTAARSQTTRVLTVVAADKAAADPELVDRATNYFLLQELQRQGNREAVARETANLLNEDAPKGSAEPDIDWLNIFASFAEKASSERMRKHWASVLAAEIRTPGTFSLTTLQLLSVVDAVLAQIISEARGWIVNDFIPLVGKLTKGPEYTKLMKLDAVGFLKLGSAKYIGVTPAESPEAIGEIGPLEMGEKEVRIQSMPRQCGVSSAILTPAGREVLELVAPAPADPEVLQAFVEHLRSHGAVVEVVDVRKGG